MKLQAMIALSGLALVAGSPAVAQGWYADGGYTFASLDDSGLEVDVGAIGGHVGYDINRNFGIEAEGAFGVADDTISGVDVSLNYLLGAYGKLQAPLSEQFSVFARAGVVQGEVEASAGGVSLSSSDTGAGYGAGALVKFNENMYIRGDYTRYDIDTTEADTFSLSLGVKF